MSETPKTTYTEQLLEWGHSGSLYPNLIPEDQDYAQLANLQLQLLPHFAGAEPVEDLHTTIFHVKPQKLFEFMATNICENLREEWLYMDLVCNFATAAYMFRGAEAKVVGLNRFGGDGSIVALELMFAPAAESYVAELRKLIKISLGRNGASQEDLVAMEAMPEYRWLLGSSKPHISLLKLGHSHPGEIPALELPDSIRFDTLASGSVSAPTDQDALRWYWMPTISE